MSDKNMITLQNKTNSKNTTPYDNKKNIYIYIYRKKERKKEHHQHYLNKIRDRISNMMTEKTRVRETSPHTLPSMQIRTSILSLKM
jgi:hypothetical protein